MPIASLGGCAALGNDGGAGCSEPPGRDELRAWFNDAHGVVAVGEAIELECQDVYRDRETYTMLLLASWLIYAEGTSGEVALVLMLALVWASGGVAPSGSRLCLIFCARGRRTLPVHRRLRAGT